MKIISYLSVFFLSLLPFVVKAQYAIAGIPGTTYVDIVPDTLLNPIPSGGFPTESYSLDINQDGTNDVKIDCHAGYSPGGSSYSGSVVSLDTSVKFSFLRTDSAQYGPGCGGPGWTTIGNVLKPYLLNDTIKAGKYISSGYMGVGGSTYNCYSFYDGLWIQNYDQYVGVRYNNGANFVYGWIRVLVSNYEVVLVKDFSLGNHIVGISNYSRSNLFELYPNPATNKVYIEGGEIQEVLFVDVLGKNILTTNEKQIDVSSLSEGIYFLQVKSLEATLTKKIIIQH